MAVAVAQWRGGVRAQGILSLLRLGQKGGIGVVVLVGPARQHPQLAVVGDYNIAPDDRDVHDPVAWAGQVLVSDKERAALQRLFDIGLTDAFRLFEQAEKSFSWWDYRQLGFRLNKGLRIDHILLSPALAARCTACVIDRVPRKWEQPSDHAPVVATID